MVELLAPAGDMECFKAALSAGADAIYVGGDKFGARAYAKNFQQEELLEALDLAHLLHKKVYMTINTLIKEAELSKLTDYLIPYYESGLDGVIVQDLGALSVMRRNFPDLEMHASTQMTITGSYGANLLKDYGVTRVVPARELSLEEIITIKKETGLEIESFIHGAMCYAYSGQCLFSSMLGQRSGNRGRCAGPCRLPYQTCLNGKVLNHKNQLYQLSLKDLCVLEILPLIVDAGIDSFKIEGRMKSPEYVSFVTGMYRKYIDRYLSNPDQYHVSKEDMQALQSKFSRGSVQTGYYQLHNGPELVTLEKPGYQSFDTNETENKEQKEYKTANNTINSKSIKNEERTECQKTELIKNKIHIKGSFTANKEKAIKLEVTDGCITVVSNGKIPDKAQKQPATREDVFKQLNKTGNTDFIFDEITINIDNDLFLPNKELNELRRQALEQMSQSLLAPYRRNYSYGIDNVENNVDLNSGQYKKEAYNTNKNETKNLIQVSLQTLEQLLTLPAKEYIGRVYISFDCLEEVVLRKAEVYHSFSDKVKELRNNTIEIFLQFPAVARQETIRLMKDYKQLIDDIHFDGYTAGNLEVLAYCQQYYQNSPCVTEARMYLFQSEAAAFYRKYDIDQHILSYELHRKEIEALLKDTCKKGNSYILPVYGYIPVMESAGCVLKTNHQCQKGTLKHVSLIDRQHKNLQVITHCSRCENTIYNAVPLSLHKEMEWIYTLPLEGVLLSFTTETPDEMNQMLEYYVLLYHAVKSKDNHEITQLIQKFPIREFTKGHFLKGVE